MSHCKIMIFIGQIFTIIKLKKKNIGRHFGFRQSMLYKLKILGLNLIRNTVYIWALFSQLFQYKFLTIFKQFTQKSVELKHFKRIIKLFVNKTLKWNIHLFLKLTKFELKWTKQKWFSVSNSNASFLFEKFQIK